jgi:hypothetical protein
MKSIPQTLHRIGNAMTMANVGNRFEFERLMRMRREQDLAAAGAGPIVIVRASAPCREVMVLRHLQVVG